MIATFKEADAARVVVAAWLRERNHKPGLEVTPRASGGYALTIRIQDRFEPDWLDEIPVVTVPVEVHYLGPRARAPRPLPGE